MAMTIKNNNAAMMTLGELNKNTTALGKQLKKVSSGQRINGAGDDASGYSISEKMRVRIRALDQNERNVQNGAALLRTAEGAIQQQIEIMKTIKQKVIDADNDTNTDIDRATIQKEIDQGYQQIDDIAQETNYNGKRLLVGDTLAEKVFSWEILDAPVETGGDLNLIPNQRQTLDNVDGPFGVFSEPWPSASSTELKNSTISKLGLATTNKFTGGTQDAWLDLSLHYADANALNNTGFSITYPSSSGSDSSTTQYFVLTNNTGNNYRYIPNTNKINISACVSVEDVANKIAAAVNGQASSVLTATASGKKVTFAGKNAADHISYSGLSGSGGQGTSGGSYTNKTGFFTTVSFSGGKDQVNADPNDPDVVPSAGAKASCTISGFGNAAADTYITIWGTSVDVSGSWTTKTAAGCTLVKENGNLVITANTVGANWNNRSVTDGKYTSQGDGTQYTAYSDISGFKQNETSHAKLSIDIPNDLDGVISALKGKILSHSSYTSYRGSPSYSPSSYNYFELEFIDSASNLSAQYLNTYKQSGDLNVDLNDLRSMVGGTTTVADALQTLVSSKLGSQATVSVTDGKLEIAAKLAGTAGNTERMYVHEGQWRSIDIDLNSLFSRGLSIPEDLDMQGFRAYCATDSSQWFNFEFVNGAESLEDRPASGTDTLDIKSILIDVSGVTNAASLAKAIYEQATPILTGPDPNYNHHMRIGADTENGIVTLFDQRQKYVKNPEIYDYQEAGAKAADGILDNVIRSKRNIYVKDLVIQHTDHSSQNIHVRVPQTTMDHLFGYIFGDRELSEFNVMTAESREALLGNKAGIARNGRLVLEDEKGYLDKALDYLTSANTLIGAQIMRLGMTENNIVTSRENTAASESTLRDADMAQEMVGYTKANVLAQAAQSMLAQANQNSSAVLSLLQ